MSRRILLSLSLLAGLSVMGAVTGCRHKKRLTSNEFDFRISPPTSTVIRTSTVTLRVLSGTSDVNPTWEVSGVGSLSTNIGREVDFSSTQLGDSTVIATYDGTQARAQIAVVTSTANSTSLEVYSDSLFPNNTNLVGANPIFDGGTFNIGSSSELNTGYTPQGLKYFRIVSTVAGSNMYWGIVLTGSPTNVNVQAYTSLNFALRINHTGGLGPPPVNVVIELEDQAAVKRGITLTSTHGLNRLSEDWQEIRILRSDFEAVGPMPFVNTAALHVPFIITLQNCPANTTFDVDAIRWEK